MVNSSMGLNTSCSFVQLLILALGCIRIRAQRTSDERPFPECDTQSCGMVGCREVRIPFSQMDAGYSPLNAICIDKTSPDSLNKFYLLTTCPNGFYNTFQNTSGICSIPGGNGTDLLFETNRLATGLHPIDCNFNNSFVYSSVIVANDNTPYRDVLVYINNTWQQQHHHDNTHVTIDVGDSLTVVFRGVGNISTINATNMINATDPRFLCETNFACNMELRLSDVYNRGMECSLHTPAELSDNGRILTVILDEMDQLNITITVRERPLVPTSLTSVIPQPTSTGAIAIIPTSSNIEQTVTSDTTSSSIFLSSSIVQIPNTGSPGQGIPPTSGSEGVPAGVIAAVIAAVIGVVVVLSTAIGIICYVRKKKRVQRRELHVEEATGAPPTTCSRSSSVRRSSITSRSMNDQQPSTSMDGPQSGTSPMLHERLQDIEDKLEEVNTGVHALKIDKTKSLKRQTSAS